MDPARSEQFTLLVAQHTRQLQRYIVTLLAAQPAAAEDVLQEVLLALWKKFPEFDPALPFLPWAFRFAYLEVLKFRRKAKRDLLIFDDALLERLASTYTDHYDMLETRRAILNQCLEKLPPADRELVRIRYESDQPIGDIADRCGVPVSKLYNGLRRIRILLLDCVQRNLSQEGLA